MTVLGNAAKEQLEVMAFVVDVKAVRMEEVEALMKTALVEAEEEVRKVLKTLTLAEVVVRTGLKMVAWVEEAAVLQVMKQIDHDHDL